MAITKQQVVDALKQVIFFAKKDNIVDLNMIQDISIKGKEIKVTIVFEKLDDPAVGIIYNSVVKTLKNELGDDITVDVKPVGDESGPLSGVKNIIAVISGKGGVGKSTVAANLAVSLAKDGSKVGILDADVLGPSVPIMFGVEGGQPKVIERKGKPVLLPLENYGIKILSIGFFVKPEQALMWRGSMANNAFNQLMTDCDWGELDYLVIDMPPGTGDIQLTLAQNYNITGAVLVTTPQKVAAADVRRAAMMYRQEKLTIPLLGIIENMSYFTPEDAPDKKYYIFGQGASDQLANELGIKVLGRIPIEPKVTETGDKGMPLSLIDGSPVSEAFKEIVTKLKAEIAKL
ncbi:Mrp/NBP35 family ATP-binding protein [Candidatus Sulfidibacterium hydrothermale]|uniref:Mrp/NBP35 family ATP-binding protein n=1 Tax=Candidatus Sulfidibacterium hydrothermale TaxID=2875962 RepID=UPI001F0A0ABB|nr:Mrp/NBP35 family ATP-binding protein [Candidatus Sulfidibacterium hydrothermale]UBM62103.1 Mrp/NBP35 family ATP-binding protein [Candidatus Sulfidibacterium hydrothermale]